MRALATAMSSDPARWSTCTFQCGSVVTGPPGPPGPPPPRKTLTAARPRGRSRPFRRGRAEAPRSAPVALRRPRGRAGGIGGRRSRLEPASVTKRRNSKNRTSNMSSSVTSGAVRSAAGTPAGRRGEREAPGRRRRRRPPGPATGEVAFDELRQQILLEIHWAIEDGDGVAHRPARSATGHACRRGPRTGRCAGSASAGTSADAVGTAGRGPSPCSRVSRACCELGAHRLELGRPLHGLEPRRLAVEPLHQPGALLGRRLADAIDRLDQLGPRRRRVPPRVAVDVGFERRVAPQLRAPPGARRRRGSARG